MVAEVVTAVEDPAGQFGVLVEPGTDGEDGDVGARAFGFAEKGPGDGGLALAVEGERDLGVGAGAMGELDGEGGKTARDRHGHRHRCAHGQPAGGGRVDDCSVGSAVGGQCACGD